VVSEKKIKQELLKLRDQIKKEKIPSRKHNENLIIATWNIRNFGKTKTARAVKYIAEICKKFDIVAIQEVKDSLEGLKKLQLLLGPDYRFIFTDPAGNNERLVYMYDRRRVDFTGLAGEIVIDPGDKKKPKVQFHRTPFMASFRTANFDFILVTVHIFYGKSKTIKFREDEIKDLAKFIESRAGDEDIYDPDIIALGDFNIVKTGDRFFNALESGGLIVENAIKKLKSNYLKNKHYDQIAYYDYIDSALEFSKAGVVDFTHVVFKEMTSRKLSYALSDHLPLWAEFKIKNYEHEQFLNP